VPFLLKISTWRPTRVLRTSVPGRCLFTLWIVIWRKKKSGIHSYQEGILEPRLCCDALRHNR